MRIGQIADVCAVRARGITKCFGDVVALDGVDLDVPAGQIHGVVGPNGAGKTTLLGLLLGLAFADRGSLEVLGTPVGAGARGARRCRGLRRRPRPLPLADRPGEPRRAGSLCAVPARRRRGSTTSSSRSGSPTSPTTRCAASPSGCASGSASPPLCSPSRACSCSTSPPTASTRRARGTCTVSSPSSRRTGPPWCSPATGWMTLRRCAPRSPSSRPGGSSSPARWASWPARTVNSTTGCVTSDTDAARQVAAETDGIKVVDDAGGQPDREVLVVRALVPALDELVPRLVQRGHRGARAHAGRLAA